MAETAANDRFVESLFKRIPPDVAETFSDSQIAALKSAFAISNYSVDIRQSINLFGKGYYLVMLMGREKRPKERRRDDRFGHPIWTIGNIIVFVFLGTLLAHTIVQVLTGFSRWLGG